MSRELLEAEYPALEEKPYLLPFCQVKRWLRLLNPQKRKQVREEINSVRAIKKEAIDSFDKLLKLPTCDTAKNVIGQHRIIRKTRTECKFHYVSTICTHF